MSNDILMRSFLIGVKITSNTCSEGLINSEDFVVMIFLTVKKRIVRGENIRGTHRYVKETVFKPMSK